MRVVCSCSSCSCSLSETEILSGWMEGDNDTQVPCPVCRKLTPVFLIFERIRKTSSWHSSLVLPSLKYGEQIYLLRPDHFREELEVQLESRKGRIWKSKESFVKNQTTLFWNAMWYFSNLDLPFERAELNRVLMTYEDSMSKGSDFFSSPFFSFFLFLPTPSIPILGIHLIQSSQKSLFQRLRQTMPARKDPKLEGSNRTSQTYNFAVNGLRRNLQGWPSRVHPLRTLYSQFDPRREDDKLALATLNDIREAVIGDDLQLAIRVSFFWTQFFLGIQKFN